MKVELGRSMEGDRWKNACEREMAWGRGGICTLLAGVFPFAYVALRAGGRVLVCRFD